MELGGLSQGSSQARNPGLKDAIPCILISIFLVWRKPNRKMGPPFPLQGEGRRRTWERESLAGPVALRPKARSAFARWSKLEPLLERVGLLPARLVSRQV